MNRLYRTSRMLKCTLTLVSLVLFAVFGLLTLAPQYQATTHAATNSTVNFQARILSDTGAVVADGTYNVEFKLYDADSGGVALWTETYAPGADGPRITTKNGYVTAALGTFVSFPGTINWDQQLYLTLNIGGTADTPDWDGEMDPRMKLTAVPYAFSSEKLQTYNGTISGSLSIEAPTVGNQVFVIPDQAAAGTYDLCIAGSADCGFALGGAGDYIQNQNAIQQATSNFWISGTGRADTSMLSPLYLGSVSADGIATIQGNNTTGNTATSPNIQFKVGDSGATTAMTILNNGNVGIGKVDPAMPLDVSGSMAVSDSYYGSDTSTRVRMNDAHVRLYTGGNARLTVEPNGNVGIGDIASDQLLEVMSSAAANTQITVANTNAGNYDAQLGFELGDTGTNLFTMGVDDSDSDKFKISTTALGTNDRLVIDSSGNVGIGDDSPSALLEVNGRAIIGGPNASTVLITGGNATMTGQWNTVLGRGAFNDATSAEDSVAIGYTALGNITSGGENTAVGSAALATNTTGSQNTALGMYALSLLGDGVYNANTAVGYSALYGYTSGAGNTAVGAQTGSGGSASGSYNSILGAMAGYGLSSGSYNLLLGRSTGFTTETGSYNILIGNSIYTPAADTSNFMSIGNLLFGNGIDGTGTNLSSGNIGIGDSTPDQKLEVMSSAAANTQITVSNTNAGDYDSQIGFELADGTNTFTIGVDDSDSDKFKISTTALGTNDRLVIDSSGLIGIGTATPTSLLTVQGTTATDVPTYGAEFLDASNWTLGSGWSGDFASGFTHSSGTATLTHDHAAANATKYKITFTVTNRNTGSFNFSFGGLTRWGVDSSGIWGPTTISTASLTITPTTDFDGTVVFSIVPITGASAPIIAVKSSDSTTRLEVRVDAAERNMFIGTGAGRYNITGYANVALGNNAFIYNTTGYGNTAVGTTALESNTTASENTALGDGALNAATSGGDNTAVGYYALRSNTTGRYNAGLGSGALYYNTTGSYNSALGTALFNNIDGYYNIGIGDYAGVYISDGATANTTSDYSIYLGSATKALADGDQNEIVIGYDAIGLGSNSVVLGNTSINTTVLRGNIGIGDDSPDQKLEVMSSAAANTQITVANTNAGNYDAQLGFELGDTGTNLFTMGVDDSDSDKFKISTTALGTNDRLVIDSTGLIGIGTASPTAKLHVVGDASEASEGVTDLVASAGTDGTFAATTGWTGFGTDWSRTTPVADKANHATGNTTALSGATNAKTTNVMYKITFTTAGTMGSGINVSLGGHDSGLTITRTGSQTVYTWATDATGTLTFTPAGSGTFAGTIDDVAIYLITSSARPDIRVTSSGGTYSQLDIRASNKSSMYMGTQSGAWATGSYNVGVGPWTFPDLTGGNGNSAFGYAALYSVTNGTENTAIGRTALEDNIAGNYNTALGAHTLKDVISGNENTGIGHSALGSLTTGSMNTALGRAAGASATTSSGNVFLGYNAGAYETGSNKLFIDNAQRASEADGRTKALIYGIFDSSVANQYLTVNGQLQVTGTGDSYLQGQVGVGGITSPTAWLHAAAPTTSAASLRLQASSAVDPSSPNIGDLWFNGTNLYFRKDGSTSTDLLASGGIGIGDTISSATEGSVLFAGPSGVLAQDNDKLFFDDTNDFLGIGTGSPDARLHVLGNSSTGTVDATNRLTATGTFVDSSGWTTSAGWTIGSGVATHAASNTGALSGTSTATSTEMVYEVTFTLNVTTAGDGLYVSLGGKDNYEIFETSDTYTIYINPSNSSGTLSFTPDGAGTFVGTIDDVSIHSINYTTPDLIVENSDGSSSNLEVRAGGDSLNNIFLGENAGLFNVSGQGNVALGSNSFITNVSGSDSTAIGNNTLQNNTYGFINTAIGASALQANTVGYLNTAIGAYALLNNTSGFTNVAVGRAAMYNNIYGAYNLAIGNYALYSSTSSYVNIAIGGGSLYQTTSGGYNVALGWEGLRNNTEGDGNVAMGYQSGFYNQTGGYNTLIGYMAGYGSTGNSFGSNVALGAWAGYALTDGGNNVLLGADAGDSITSGDNNIIIGQNAGDGSLQTGSNNILIGYDIDTPANNTASFMSIGNLLFATGGFGTGTSVGAGNIGVGVANPSTFKLQVAGDIGPNADDQYDLGSSSLRWQDLYLGPASLHIASTVAETGTAREWKFGIQETDGSSEGNLRVLEGSTEIMNITPTGYVGIGSAITAPTAYLQVTAPTSSASSLRLTASSAVNPSSPNIGDMWFNGTNLYFRKDGSTTVDLLGGSSGANTALSNLASVAINTSLISDADNTDDLGSATYSWKDVYTRTVKFDGATSGTITLLATGTAGTNTITLPAQTGTVCTTASVCTGYQASGSFATTTLNNLGSVAINTSLISDANNTDDLGSATYSWKDVYTRTVKFDGATSGTITLQAAATAGTNTITLPAQTGTVCTTASVCTGYQASGSFATTTLNNLGSVAINTSLISDANNTDDLGSATYSWKDVYTRTVKFDGATSGTITLQAAATAGTNTITLPAETGTICTSFSVCTGYQASGTYVNTIGTLDTTPGQANGAYISGSSLYLQVADASYPGLVSTGTQTFAGTKTFNGFVTFGMTGTGLATTNAATIGGTLYLGTVTYASRVSSTARDGVAILADTDNNDANTYSAFGVYVNATGMSTQVFNVLQDGTTYIGKLAAASSTTVCRDGSGNLSTCSSSIRYKTNVQDLQAGLDVVRKLRPVAFDWKATGERDFGLIAEEVKEIDPLFVFNNDAGEIEGVRYAQFTSVLANAIKEVDSNQQELSNQLNSINVLLSSYSYPELNISGPTTLKTLFVTGEISTQKITVQDLATINILKVTGPAEFGGDINLAASVNTKQAITKRFIASKAIAAGSVVVIDVLKDGYVTTTEIEGDTKIIGVAINEALREGDEIQVAIGGSVQVLADDLNDINSGDLIITNKYAGLVKSTANPVTGSLLGKATSSKDSNNLIWVLITLQ